MFDQSGDVTKAKKWYKRATYKDHEKARNNLDALNYMSDEGGSSSLRIMPIRDKTFVDLSNRKENKKSGGAREGSGRKKAACHHCYEAKQKEAEETFRQLRVLFHGSTNEIMTMDHSGCGHY